MKTAHENQKKGTKLSGPDSGFDNSFHRLEQEIDPGLNLDDWSRVGSLINELRAAPAWCGKLANTGQVGETEDESPNSPALKNLLAEKGIEMPNDVFNAVLYAAKNGNGSGTGNGDNKQKLQGLSPEFLEKLLGALFECTMRPIKRQRS